MYGMNVTDLEVRRVTFDFADDVPFCWLPENPEFALANNIVSLMIIGFEKFIVDAIRGAEPSITDPAVAAEADAFLRQEAQHSRAHRMHSRALARQYPGLKDVVDDVVAEYDRLFAAKPLEYSLAYIADLEATFTPQFKLWLDHADELFGPGDERVASLFLWHYTEEIEHRSSALIVFDHVVGKPWYRLRQLPSVLRHVGKITKIAVEGINRHVPFEDRKIDARSVLPVHGARRTLARKYPILGRNLDLSYPGAFDSVPAEAKKRSNRGILASQSPKHDPEHQPLPAFAAEWVERYERGDDVAHWYSSLQEVDA
jgi:predicted metal-dependent hydrolase